MLIKYISFLIGVIWSYSIIKTQSVFSNKAGIIFKIFVTKVSWFTLIAACYYGYKNFEDFYKKKGLKEENKTDRYLQKSNIFSYFVMRSMVIFNINDFIKLCRDKNKRNFFKQDFECVEFLPIVLKTLKDPLFESTINNNIVSNKQGNKGKVVFNNLRMTCIEVKI